MVKTLVGYPDEPSRKAMIAAGLILTVAGGYVARKNKEPIIRIAAGLATPLMTRPLAMMLTRMGLI